MSSPRINILDDLANGLQYQSYSLGDPSDILLDFKPQSNYLKPNPELKSNIIVQVKEIEVDTPNLPRRSSLVEFKYANESNPVQLYDETRELLLLAI